jgi:BASS family bile acid:Na+ symporter
VRRPRVLVLGLAANLALPIAFIYAVSGLMAIWHNPDEVQSILVGLALVAAMPIAGSSTAWAQNADGDLALSLGLVVASTVLSPLTTPVALHAVGSFAAGEYATELHSLAAHGTQAFLGACILFPSLVGIALRVLIGEARYQKASPLVKLTNLVTLVTLTYSNAAISLPQAFSNPDADFLVAILAITSALCIVAFGAGWGLARLLGAGVETQASLMYGLGMNNNGTGLVLAAMVLSGHPRVLLPIIFYNLVQQVVAGVAAPLLCRSQRASTVDSRERLRALGGA